MAAFCGVNVHRNESLPAPKETRTPSARAVAKLESIEPMMSVNDYRTVIGRIADEDDGQSKFQPFSTDERRLLREIY